ncbi:zinc-ribbon domain-containing protein [Stagnihabitans tardus]|uniref:Zinc finger/thioredoxin putative domain-containing protein n=1 Tax=Stagnihabitans tardus TaxID=2699202 RepID=A0AAE5BVW9_9RHOB|nr:zinc-ribbon domain-containing protein [Stagnihabitans tardus]NBZ88204.1 hypothetical protein [Stagnihabitans tardus]
MRLQCPNCDAEYEVDDAAIPASGRDVQCSACGHAWFQEHPHVKAEAEEEEALFGAPSAERDAPEPALAAEDPEAVETPAPQVVAEPETLPAWEPEDVLAAEAAVPLNPVPEPEPAPEPEPLRRSIDESVLAVLREEAEREAAARRGERPRIETQTEMTLTDAPRPTRPLARTSPVVAEPEAQPETLPEAPRKRTLLPEIEEIKSSLNPAADPEDESAARAPATGEGGFRRGFVFALLFAVILLALYVMAPLIVAKLPALKGPMEAYVQAVNSLRRALDTQVRGLIGWLQSLAGGSAG